MQQTLLLCPLYRDEASFREFAARVFEVSKSLPGHRFSFLVVNDGTPLLHLKAPLPLTVIHLHRNIGHQKAIAIGLAYAHTHLSFDQVLIMDCDGEDAPEDILLLLSKQEETRTIVVASRRSRQESSLFRLFYQLYKALFFLLTGKRISFGNFMVLPRKEASRLAHFPEIWSHLAGAVIKSRTPYARVPAHRGRRYQGNSQMNFTALLLHGLGAIGVFVEVIASRLLLFSAFLILLSLLAIVLILFIKFFTTRAIPGWATSALSSMLIVLLQSCLLSMFTIFLYLTSQGQRKFIPALHYTDYVAEVEKGPHD
jgi:hypothetical protein